MEKGEVPADTAHLREYRERVTKFFEFIEGHTSDQTAAGQPSVEVTEAAAQTPAAAA